MDGIPSRAELLRPDLGVSAKWWGDFGASPTWQPSPGWRWGCDTQLGFVPPLDRSPIRIIDPAKKKVEKNSVPKSQCLGLTLNNSPSCHFPHCRSLQNTTLNARNHRPHIGLRENSQLGRVSIIAHHFFLSPTPPLSPALPIAYFLQPLLLREQHTCSQSVISL